MLKMIQKIPGGLMIVPMLVVALINTVAPGTLQIGTATTGAFTSAGTMTVIGIILVISGSQLKVAQLAGALKRGGVLCIVKILLGFAVNYLVLSVFGAQGFFGISALALVVAMSSCNPGVYMALIQDFGDTLDKAVFGLLNVIAVPALPLLIMSIGAGGAFDPMTIVAMIVPFLVGMLLGNIDDAFTKLLAPGTPICLIFLGCCFGSNINLLNAVAAGPSGVLLSALYLLVNIPLFLLTDRVLIRRPGYAGVAMSSVAGVACSAPAIIVAAMPQYGPYVEAATSQLALAVVITSFAAPYITKAVVSKFGTAAKEV